MQYLLFPESLVQLQNSKVTLRSFAPTTRSTVKLMRHRSLAKIIAGGTYEWTPVEPGEEYPPHDEIVAKSWAFACKKLGTDFPFLVEHPKHVSTGFYIIF
jgi:hypothetical protein